MTVKDYLDLIPSANAVQPNFTSMISVDVSIPIQVQDLLKSMVPIFDISLPPLGNQLDIIGQWVGVSRAVSIPSTGIFFSWDSPASQGWDYGTWQIPGQATVITSLPDDAYLILILGKIAANNWDGTINGAYAIWNELFSPQGITILIQDHQNMSYAMGIVGTSISSLALALITGGYIPLRPEGVQITGYFTGPAPFFAWDVPNGSLLGGWDYGKWSTVSTNGY